jgi:hypothetical protein
MTNMICQIKLCLQKNPPCQAPDRRNRFFFPGFFNIIALFYSGKRKVCPVSSLSDKTSLAGGGCITAPGNFNVTIEKDS